MRTGHIAWHLSAGFVWTVLEQPAFVENEMEIPQIMAQYANAIPPSPLPEMVANLSRTCTDWSAWTSRNVVDQVGLAPLHRSNDRC